MPESRLVPLAAEGKLLDEYLLACNRSEGRYCIFLNLKGGLALFAQLALSSKARLHIACYVHHAGLQSHLDVLAPYNLLWQLGSRMMIEATSLLCSSSL